MRDCWGKVVGSGAVAIALTLASMVLPSPVLQETAAVDPTGIGIVGVVTITAIGSSQLISLFKVSSLTPQASRPFLCDLLGAIGMPCDPSKIVVLDVRKGQETTYDQIKKALQDKAEGKLKELLKKLISRGYDQITIGADARPTADGRKFTYRTYTRPAWDNKVYVSRWDFYPPGRWTINTWFADLNKDGRADIVLSSKISGFYIAWR